LVITERRNRYSQTWNMLLKICREKIKPFAEYRITFYSREMADAGNFGGSVPEYKQSPGDYRIIYFPVTHQRGILCH
ncbi:hypothetical protein ACVRBD_004565, partial [Salmonella enterica subsp. enterica]